MRITIGSLKAPLSKAIFEECEKLVQTINLVPANFLLSKIIDGTGGKVSIANIISYQIGWGSLLISWYEAGVDNKKVIMPGDGFTSWDYTEIAQHFYKKYENDTIEELKEKFFNIVTKIIAITEREYNNQQLDVLGIWSWCTLKSGKQWPLSKWITVNTIASYKRARALIKNTGNDKEPPMSFLSLLSPQEKKLVHKQAMPSFIKPMLATLTKNYFSDKEWIFERKLDGERCFLYKKGASIILKTRNNNIINKSYPEIEQALKKLNLPNCILDGEIVAFDKKITSFSLLQGRFGVSNLREGESLNIPVFYYVFDILYCESYLLTHLPLLARKKILQSLLPKNKTIVYVPHKDTNGIIYLKQACKNKWEGLIAKKNDSMYVSKRSSNWLKFKCSNEQELVIGGYTSPGGSRLNFGALLLGYYERGKLHYAGKVGTGFNATILNDLGKKLKALETKKNPFVNFDDSSEDIHWVKPKLVCEVQFTEWTKTNKLRHPSYLGLRRDKAAKEVKKEESSL